MMPKEIAAAGENAFFFGIPCRLLDVQSDNRLRLALLFEETPVQMPPLYGQDICWIQAGGKLFWCIGEVMERYHSENKYIVSLEIKNGFYEAGHHTVNVRVCRLEAMLSVEGGKWQPVLVTAISTAEAFLYLPDCGLPELSETSETSEEKEAALKLEGMLLKGYVTAQTEGEQNPSCEMRFSETDLKILRKLTESIVFGEKSTKTKG